MATKTVTEEQIAEYVARPYARILTPAEEGGYVAEILEIPGAISEGDTAEEAVAMVNDALGGVIAVMLEDGQAIPEANGFNEYSGRFNQRVPTDVHREAAMRAQLEGVSLNQWISQAIVARLAATSLADEVVEKLRAVLASPTRTSRRLILEETEESLQLQLNSPETNIIVPAGQFRSPTSHIEEGHIVGRKAPDA